MAWRHAILGVVWMILSALVTASSRRTCLTSVTPYSAHQRKNVTVDGIHEPLRIGYSLVPTSMALSWLAKVLLEEVFGIHVERVRYRDSIGALHAVSGCKRPDAISTEGAGCELPGPAPAHIALSVWQSVHVDAFLAWMKLNRPAQHPIGLGDIGYTVQNGLIVKEGVAAAAMQADHLPLDYYMSYSHPRIDVSSYFDSLHSIPASVLAPCSSTVMNHTPAAKLYLATTGDIAGLNAREDAFACAGGHWWLAPACRADVSRCIPVLASEYSDHFTSTAQRAFKWGMPLALAFTKDIEAYTRLPREFRMLVFAVFPGAASVFAGMGYHWVKFPPHDPEEWSAGVMFSEHPRVYIGKWASSGMLNRTNDGTARVLAFMRSFRVSARLIEALAGRAVLSGVTTDAGFEPMICDWANQHTAIWQSLITSETTCFDGQGLVNGTGAFVANRTAATSCVWCPPGRVSAQLRDAAGTTYQCSECQPGRAQAAVGMIACDLCAPGTEAPSPGMAACTRCGLAEYAMVAGAAQCSACPQGFVTPFEGAESADACVCPAGKYRDGARRDRCLECEVGMACPVGSDALGLDPERRPRYPIAPELEPGFWSSEADPLSVFRCEDAIRCRGGRPGALCSDKLEGQSCQHCLRGFFWNGETCQQCSTNLLAYVVFPILPCIALPMIIIVLYKITGGGYDSWDSWRNCVLAMLFLLLHHYQVMQVIYRTDTSFTDPASEAMRSSAWASDLWSVVNLSCYGVHSFSSKLILRSLGPMLVLGVYAAVWVASRLVGRCYPSVKMEGNRTLSGFFSIILAFFTGIADTALTVFKCARNPNGKYSLASDRSILCFEDEWNGLLAIGVVSVTALCGGMVLVCVYAISTAPSQFHRPEIRARWKFIFIRYRADVHWWALLVVVKGIVVNLSCVVMSAGLGQVTWIIVTLLVYVHLASCYRPWRSILNNAVDIDAHLNLVLAAASMYLFPVQANWDSTLLGETLVKVVSYTPPAGCLPFAVLIYVLKASSWARSKKATDLALLAESVHLLAAGDRRLVAFLQGLAESDWLVMVKVKDLVQTELAAKKSRAGYRGLSGMALAPDPAGQQDWPETRGSKQAASAEPAQPQAADSALGGVLGAVAAKPALDLAQPQCVDSAGGEVRGPSATVLEDAQGIGAPRSGAAGGGVGPQCEPDDDASSTFSF